MRETTSADRIKLSVRGRSPRGRDRSEYQGAGPFDAKGYRLEWNRLLRTNSGRRRLAVIVPVTLLLVFFLVQTFDSGGWQLILVNVLYAAAAAFSRCRCRG